MNKMSTQETPKPEESVYVSTPKLIGDLLFAMRDITVVLERLEDRIEALEDVATAPIAEIETTNYGRAVICGTIYEIDQDLDSATITVHPSEHNERLTYSSETVAGAIATLLDDQGDDGLDYLLGLALAVEDLGV
jgi:hypothetical protein